MVVTYRMFKSGMKTRQTLFNEATEFASKIGNDRFINISHSCDAGTAVVCVWYRDNLEAYGTSRMPR